MALEVARGTSKTGTRWILMVDTESMFVYWLHCEESDGSCKRTRRFDVDSNRFVIAEDRDRHVIRRVKLALSRGRI